MGGIWGAHHMYLKRDNQGRWYAMLSHVESTMSCAALSLLFSTPPAHLSASRSLSLGMLFFSSFLSVIPSLSFYLSLSVSLFIFFCPSFWLLSHFLYRERSAALLWMWTFGGFYIGYLRDMWRIPTYVAEYNYDKPFVKYGPCDIIFGPFFTPSSGPPHTRRAMCFSKCTC